MCDCSIIYVLVDSVPPIVILCHVFSSPRFHIPPASPAHLHSYVVLNVLRAGRFPEEDCYDEEEEPDKGDIQAVISTLNAKLEDLQTCHDLIAKHASTLHR